MVSLMTKYERGSVHLIIVIVAVLAVVSLLIFTFFQVVQGREQLANDSVQTFGDCKRLRISQVLETYPEQCVTESGKKFTDPTQNVKPLATTKQFTSKKHSITFSYPEKWTVNELISKDVPEYYASEVTVKTGDGKIIAYLRTGGQYGGACSPSAPFLETVRFGSETMKRPGFAGTFGYANTAVKGVDGKYRIAYGISKFMSDTSQDVQCPEQAINYQYIVPVSNETLGSVQFGRWYDVSDDGYASLNLAKNEVTMQEYIDAKKMILSLAINS